MSSWLLAMKHMHRVMDANAQDDQRHSQPSGYSFFMPQQPVPGAAGFRNNNFGRGRAAQDMSRGRGRFEMRELNIRRELEKQQIREEIIAEEMARRRVLEAEVRNELMMERQMAMRHAACMPLSETKYLDRKPIGLEEKLVMLIDDKYGRGGRLGEVGGFSGSPLQVLGDSPKITAVRTTPAPEDNKKEVIVYSKPDETLSGTKRKSTPPVSEGSIQSGSDRSNKRVKEEWTCAVCQITTTSEQGLTQHIQGKKHQTKEAALVAQRTGANFGLGVAPKKPIIKSPQLALTTVTVSSNETSKPSTSSSPNDIKSGKIKKDKFKFWCEMCQVGAFSEAVMNDHKEGKKHSARLVRFYRKRKVDLEASVTETKSNQAMEHVAAEENNETN